MVQPYRPDLQVCFRPFMKFHSVMLRPSAPRTGQSPRPGDGPKNNRRHDFYFVVANKNDGDIEIFKASDSLLETGRRKYKKAIKLFKHYSENKWDFGAPIKEINAPYWNPFAKEAPECL